KYKLNNFMKVITLFLIGSCILSLLELISGVLIEKVFNLVFWDYSDLKYNIGKYIALEMAILWGSCSVLFYYVLKPITDKIVLKIPKYITIMFIFIFIIDSIATLILK
ncbi:MAG TPA: putative ABC transporter permease, partial [Tenericutes bacterium]|nr:putative ABC transporter permease [Mycoplasmatota bacterium]